MKQVRIDALAEWLEPDGLGGFAMGTVGSVRMRRYHGLLLTATNPPTGRLMLVNGFDAWVETPSGAHYLTAQKYTPGVIAPDRPATIESFESEPWPTWRYTLPDDTSIEHELFAVHGSPIVALRWRLLSPHGGVTLHVRPFLSGRDYHSMQHENGAMRFEPRADGDELVWQTYDGVPEFRSRCNGEYRHEPHWYRGFLYDDEQRRGLDCVEDLASPGVLRFDLSERAAEWVLCAGWKPAVHQNGLEAHSTRNGLDAHRSPNGPEALSTTTVPSFDELRTSELERRSAFATPIDRAADGYLVKRREGKTIVAGYPWFTDWGRDTFIALRGLCLATGRFDDARDILLEWSGAVSEGMLPNRFPDSGEQPEYNSVDASLWYVIAVSEFLAAADAGKTRIAVADRRRLETAVREIVAGYERGTRFDIRCDDDGLLAAGEPGVQLTWMDAKVGDWVVTPRIGKPVEVQALWLSALWAARSLDDRWTELFVRGRDAFRRRFWSAERGCLYDVIDVDHRAGKADPAFRPNQIFAIGGLPIALFDDTRARQIVDAVEARLWTPLGLRSLAPDDPAYVPHYRGDVRQRDGAYHQGTVWPWLIGPFVEAWVRVRGGGRDVKREAYAKFVAPLREHLNTAGLGHISEIADAAEPHAPGGCPFQAWSIGELLRLERVVLADSPPPTAPREDAADNPSPKRKRGSSVRTR
ncbi:MAG: amylo-alpha-1,6-glucosidase [Phycisphaerae bacterium]